MFCKHKWEKLHEHTSESAFDQMRKAGATNIKNFGIDFFERQHFVIVTCSKCGAIKKFQSYF